MDTLPQCTAKSKQSGTRCRNFTVKGKAVCWIHGGKSTGPITAKGRDKIRKLKLKHGLYSQDAIDEQKQFRKLLLNAKETLEKISDQMNS
ncbi:MAG: hypothetical protein JSR76_05485 [Verrucomicrobia bacterium]|nr:hypothetical protein [Verrucomicrobiota bacterium]